MHHMGISLDGVELLYFYGTEVTDLTEIISSEVNEHIVLGEFFWIGKKLDFQCHVFCTRRTSRTCTCKRECVKHTVLELNECLRRSSCDLYVCSREVEHVRARVDGTKYTVSVQETSFKRCLQAVRKNNLEDITLEDVVLALLDHLTELVLFKECLDFTEEFSGLFFGLLTVMDEIRKVTERLYRCFVVLLDLLIRKSVLTVCDLHVFDEDDLLL